MSAEFVPVCFLCLWSPCPICLLQHVFYVCSSMCYMSMVCVSYAFSSGCLLSLFRYFFCVCGHHVVCAGLKNHVLTMRVYLEALRPVPPIRATWDAWDMRQEKEGKGREGRVERCCY